MKPVKVFLFLIYLSLVSCSEQEKILNKQLIPAEAKNFTKEEKSLVDLDKPIIINISSRPEPQIIHIPTKNEGLSYAPQLNTSLKIKLTTPKVISTFPYYLMGSFSTEQGLSIDTVTSGALDKLGNLWFGTGGGGVTRFDGVTFKNYTISVGLPSNYVESILADSKGNLWFGTAEGGISKYDGQSFSVLETGLNFNFTVWDIFEDKKGNIWYATSYGILKNDGKSLSIYNMSNGLENNYIRSIGEDSEGNMWFGSNGNGVSRFDGKSFTNFNVKDGLSGNIVISIFLDKSNNLWLGTEGNGVSKFDGKFHNFTVKEGLINDNVYSIIQDKNGSIWFGTDGGASELNFGKFTNYTQKNGLSGQKIRTIVEDKVGNLWFGTYDGGVCRFNGKAFTNYTPLQGIGSVRTILEDKDGFLWLGTQDEGLIKFDKDLLTFYTVEQGLPNNNIQSIYQESDGSLWIATFGGGISHFDGKSFTNYSTKQGLAGNFLRSILKDKLGNLWFSTKTGVSKFDGKTFTNFGLEQGLPNSSVRALLLDKNDSIWFGTFGGGLSRFDGKKFVNFTKNEGLPNDFIMCLLEDQAGNIWIGTQGSGVSRYDGKSFKNFSMLQGMSDDVIYSMTLTQEHDIAFGTKDGINLLKGFIRNMNNINEGLIPAQTALSNEDLNQYHPLFEIYSSQRGYPVKDANGSQNNFILDKNGIMWLGTSSKKTSLIRFDYLKLNKSSLPPEVKIYEIKINNSGVVWSDLKNEKNQSIAQTEEFLIFGKLLNDIEKNELFERFKDVKYGDLSSLYYIPSNLVLPYKHNSITISFAAIDTNLPQNIYYQYKLEGYENDWSPPTKSNKATFGNLLEGNYIFKVRAKNTYGIWSEPITYDFTILPPWYRTWWAYFIYISGSSLLFYSILRWRTAKLRRQYERAERFVPKKVLELLNKKHLDDVELGDSVEIKLSAMFADIRGFTTLSETLTPSQTALFLNTYTRYMAPIIRKNNGFINQFLGDGILALFPEKASDSIDAALAMINILPQFNEEIEAQGYERISVGIGLNSGQAMLFALGEKERLEASIVSDAINTASRVEGLNKIYKTQLLISESVYSQLLTPEKYFIRLVDKVFLKGKNVGTRIYEVRSISDSQVEKDYNLLYHEGFFQYEKGNFIAAEAIFKDCLIKKPSDEVAKLLLTRCINFKGSILPRDWDGTIRLLEK